MTLVSTAARGGGGTFNGGTITEGLTIADPDGAESQLTITGTGSGTAKLIDASAVHTIFTVDSDGTVALKSDDTIGVLIEGTSATDANLSAQALGGSASVNATAGGGNVAAIQGLQTGGNLYVQAGGNTMLQAGPTFQFFAYNAAPADGSLAAGQCALWFDSTNGAAALNVKAKQANGTVKTATIPVIT